MDQVKATISSGYRWRLVLITLLMLGFAGYCLYDWQIGYPRIKEIGLAYQELKAQDDLTIQERWPDYARERGWPTDPSKIKLKSEAEYDSDILTQLIMFIITGAIGVYFLGKLIVENRRWVAMDDQGLSASGGRRAPWESVRSLDETKWKTKGIAYVIYDDAGTSRRILLDDFKAEREPVKTIVHAVQARLHREPTDPIDDPSESPASAAV